MLCLLLMKIFTKKENYVLQGKTVVDLTNMADVFNSGILDTKLYTTVVINVYGT